MSRGILSFFCGRAFAPGVVRHTVHFRSWLAESPRIRTISPARLELRVGQHETTGVLNRRSLIPAVTANLLVFVLVAATPPLGWGEIFLRSVSQARSARTTSSGIADLQKTFGEGEAALQRGELDTAEAAFRKVLAADPRAGAAYANLGVIAMRRKQWDQALAMLQRAERLEPGMTGIRLNIGLVKYRTGDYVGAIERFASVVREQPDAQQARYLLGLCHLFAEHYGEAVSYLEPLWSQQPNNFMYFYVLGIAAHNAGRKDLDERALNRLLEIGGEVPEFHLILGKAYLNRGEPEKAIP